MVGRRIKVLGLMCLAAGATACSKTQDTAPERRIFGAPPSIESVEVTSAPASSVTCEWTLSSMDALCQTLPELAQFCPPPTPQDPEPPCEFRLQQVVPSPFPTITVNVTYNEVNFQVRATDPESTPSQSDILLVTASYISNQDGQPVETSLIILDDGGAAGSNQFSFKQRTTFYGEDCTAVPFSCPTCTQKTYTVDSNDLTAGDGLYTRGFAFSDTSGGGVPAGARASELLADCLVSKRRQSPQLTSNLGGRPVDFKIEAIDRSGNIATWPVQPEVVIQPGSLTCTGDPCLCCIMTNADVFNGCRCVPGMNGPFGSGYENGLCFVITKAFFGIDC